MGVLKRLELTNFKSYKGHQVVGPFKHFTAIIGPNGSGKSNLMDAISFVLGEKTQNLRVRNLKDLIHGAPIGKPIASRAKVTAVYEEEDGSEIPFTRIIIGSGTEYRVSGKVVTPGEYQDRLEGLGILIKAKNFLVFQGAVESIAMKTPKERTQLFEQISRSGELSGEYEQKKVAMLKTQEETNFSYHKKKGIAMERKDAKVEKDEAEKYRGLQIEITECQLEEQLFKLYHKERRIDVIVDSTKNKQKELDKMLSRRSKIEEQLKSKKQESAKWAREVATLEKRMREKEVEAHHLKPQFMKAKELTAHTTNRLKANKKSHKAAEKKVEEHEQRIESLEVELKDVTRRHEQLKAEMDEGSQDPGVKLVASQVEDYKKLKNDAEKKSAGLKQKLDRLSLEQRSDEEACEGLRLKKEELQENQQKLRDDRAGYERRIEGLDVDISAANNGLSKVQRELEKLSEEVSQADYRYSEINEKLSGITHKLGDAKYDRNENTRQMRKTEILENLKRLHANVYGRLIDLCEPTQRKFSLALTKVMGRNMDAIVVDCEKTAKDCIQYIKEQHSEPCTFIPLESIETKPINETLRQLSDAQLIIDIMTFEEVFRPAVVFACGNSLVCDTMEDARRVAFGSNERRKTVSLDGTLFQKSGIISGGASDLRAKAKRWDEKQLDGLRRQRDRLKEEFAVVMEARNKKQNLPTMQSNVTGLENKIRYAKRDKQVQLDHNLPRSKREMEVNERELEDIEPRVAEIKSTVEARSTQIKKLTKKVDNVEDEIYRDFCRSIGVDNIRQFEGKHLKSHQDLMNKGVELSGIITRLQSQMTHERQSTTTSNKVRKFAASITEDEKLIAKFKKDEGEKLKAIEGLEAAIDALREKREGLKKEMDDQELAMREVRKMQANYVKDISQVQKKIGSLETELDKARADRHSLLKGCKMEDIKLPFSRGRMEDIGDDDVASAVTASQSEGSTIAMMDVDSMSSQGARLWYEREAKLVLVYSLLEDDLKELDDEDAVAKKCRELNAKVGKLQSNLQRINAPNMKADEKLDNVETRFQETADAFEQARQMAKKTKSDFEKTKKKRYDRFVSAFEHVSEVIDSTYKELSNNPSAQAFLSPENADEPYLDGISYNCIAPGKRFRPMDNLSGGEKTVAALALLFSIHSYQPAPFFVLDEIDAALDNTNINRVANYIHKQTATNFQCIVISLKEEFYSHADALIGIYSELGGECTVSRTLTHDLVQYPLSSASAVSPSKVRV